MKLEILDTTLRDGAQSSSVKYSVADMENIARTVTEMGISLFEVGNLLNQPKEIFEFISGSEELKRHAVAFGSTRRKDTTAADDENVRAIAETGIETVTIVGKASLLQVEKVLMTTADENIRMIEDTVRFFREKERRVIFDAEHFFDGYKYDADYALATIIAAARAGADVVVLCDTNGGSFPSEISAGTKAAKSVIDVGVGVHCHDDQGLAVANTIAAVEAGASHVQGTVLGFGERCGNTNLIVAMANLQLKLGYECIPNENISSLTHFAKTIAEISNTELSENMPYVGGNAFCHKAGMHTNAVLKYADSFEHISPEAVGNSRKLLLSELSGKSAISAKLNRILPETDRNMLDADNLQAIVNKLKALEYCGYQFEGAEASLMLTVEKVLGRYRKFFELVNYKCINEQPGSEEYYCTAVIKIRVGNKTRIQAAEGAGPVNALDLALRRALIKFYPDIGKMYLKDYKVRVLNPQAATASVVRVLITSAAEGKIWNTVGVSQDIIEASFLALVDSFDYDLSGRKALHGDR